MYDVAIIGAGPAGLFTAYELITKNNKLKVVVIDRGSKVKNRVCPMNKKGVPCQNCNPCAILSGYGGAGTFSDGKLNTLTKDIENGQVDACYSRQLCDNNTIEKYTRECNYPAKSKIVSKDDINKLGLKTFFFSDASSAIKRETFVKLNGYDHKKLVINEDMYIAYKLITNGYKIKYCADSEIVHSHIFTLKQYYNRYKDTGKFFKENDYLNNYRVNQAGGNMAKYILKRAIQDKNWGVLVKYIPNMAARFIGMKVGKI